MTFDELRAQHPVFTYEGYDYSLEGEGLRIQFHYRIGDAIRFDPTMLLLAGRNARYPADLKTLEGIIFHIGMIELLVGSPFIDHFSQLLLIGFCELYQLQAHHAYLL